MSRVAIAIFAFNRPESLERIIFSLYECPEIDGTSVNIFIDGPRNELEREQVAQTAKVASASRFRNVRIVQSSSNKGLRRSIYDGVSQICEEFGRVIVLEDDLVLSPYALEYFIGGLDRFEKNDRVWSICGYTYEHPRLSKTNRAFFLPFAHPWGWATWARAWRRFEFDQPLVSSQVLGTAEFRRFFDVGGLSRATDLLDLAQRGKVDSWFIRWHWKIFREGGVSLFPSRRFVVNRGVSEGGTHAGTLNPYRLLAGSPDPSGEMPISWPDEITPDFEALSLMRRSRDASVQRFIAWAGRIKRLYLKR